MESAQTTTAITWIDRVLDYLAAPAEGEPPSELVYTNYVEDNVIWKQLILMFPDMEGEHFQSKLTGILEKLRKDGFVEVKEIFYDGMNKKAYRSTFEGELFSQNGGYRSDLDERQKSENSAKANRRSILGLTFVLATASLTPFLWYLKELTKSTENNSIDFWSSAILLINGAVVGALILATGQELLKWDK